MSNKGMKQRKPGSGGANITKKEKLDYLKENYKDKTVNQLAEEMGVSNTTVRNYCKKYKLKTKPDKRDKKDKECKVIIRIFEDERPVKRERPPTVYSNPNYSSIYY